MAPVDQLQNGKLWLESGKIFLPVSYSATEKRVNVLPFLLRMTSKGEWLGDPRFLARFQEMFPLMQDAVNSLMLVCAILASLAFGVLVAYSVCRAAFVALRLHAGQVAAERARAAQIATASHP